MSTVKQLNNKWTDKRKHMVIDRDFAKIQPDELKPLVQVVNSNSSCAAWLTGALVIGAAVAMAIFGSGNIKLGRTS